MRRLDICQNWKGPKFETRSEHSNDFRGLESRNQIAPEVGGDIVGVHFENAMIRPFQSLKYTRKRQQWQRISLK